MRRDWTLRQLLATVRGIGFMLGVFWIFVAVQFLPSLMRGGFSGMRKHLVQVATAGVPKDLWPVAIAHMQEALAMMAALALLAYVGQRILARKVGARPLVGKGAASQRLTN